MKDLYRDRKAVVGVIGLGYVGMPLALAAVEAGFFVVGFDVDGEKTASINAGQSYIKHIASEAVAAAVLDGRLQATTVFHKLASVEAIVICVPTPRRQRHEETAPDRPHTGPLDLPMAWL